MFKKLFSKALQQNNNKLTGFEAQQTESFIFQGLETIHIINTTKNKETFFSRLDFFDSIFFKLKEYSEKSNFKDYAYPSGKFFEDSYGEKNTTDDMIILVTKTRDFDYESFKIKSIYSFMIQYIQNEIDSANKLKLQSAKLKRKEKLINDVLEFKTQIINRCLNSNILDDILKTCDDILDQIKNFE